MGTKTSIDVVIRIANRYLALVMSVCASSILLSPFLASETLRSLHIGAQYQLELLLHCLLLSQSALRSNMDLTASRAGDWLSGDGDTKSSSCVDSASGWFSGR
ncbi:hypothetical protein L1987_18275 [Smallanthus sonchifolius]|uniref:Uncharacterized protein n=1 Tax=Smallanthus sonchifolius TaxID=185202 RepID=A0ACB9IZ47_9ASTR|nr:hypothetical protein L1987_18275 [Smallanthus sonchifolius]